MIFVSGLVLASFGSFLALVTVKVDNVRFIGFLPMSCDGYLKTPDHGRTFVSKGCLLNCVLLRIPKAVVL